MSLPNFITLFRILLIPFFFTTLVSYTHEAPHHRISALILFSIAAATDALDGFLARLTRCQTRLGQFLDPLADKLLLLSGFIGVLFVDALPYRPPIWVTVTIVFRDIFLVGGMVSIFIMSGEVRIIPNFLGKMTTAAQMAALITILVEWQYAFYFWNITAILTILSCFSYIHREMSKLKDLP